MLAVLGTMASLRMLGKRQRRCAPNGETRISFSWGDMLLGVLVSVVTMRVAINVMHAPIIPALERVVVAGPKGETVSQPESPGHGIVMADVPVEPGSISIRGLVPVVMIF